MHDEHEQSLHIALNMVTGVLASKYLHTHRLTSLPTTWSLSHMTEQAQDHSLCYADHAIHERTKESQQLND